MSLYSFRRIGKLQYPSLILNLLIFLIHSSFDWLFGDLSHTEDVDNIRHWSQTICNPVCSFADHHHQPAFIHRRNHSRPTWLIQMALKSVLQRQLEMYHPTIPITQSLELPSRSSLPTTPMTVYPLLSLWAWRRCLVSFKSKRRPLEPPISPVRVRALIISLRILFRYTTPLPRTLLSSTGGLLMFPGLPILIGEFSINVIFDSHVFIFW